MQAIRATLAISAALALVTGCSEAVRHNPTATATDSSIEASAPESTSAVAAPSAAPARGKTEIVHFSAIDAATNPAPGWTSDRPPAGDFGCDHPYPSPSSVSDDIVECGPSAAGAHTCWVQAKRDSLICAIDPVGRKYNAFTLTKPLPTVKASTKPQPQWIVLDDGTRCGLRRGGAWGSRPDGLLGAYGCTGVKFVVLADKDTQPVDTSTPQWTVQVGELGTPGTNFPPPERRTVAKAYFAAAPR